MSNKTKTLGNTTANGARKNVSDLTIWGDGDMFKLLCKASSQNEGWMKSTKAMEIEGVGCVVQVTTQQVQQTGFLEIFTASDYDDPNIDTDNPRSMESSAVAEAVTFVPGVRIEEIKDGATIIARKLVKL